MRTKLCSVRFPPRTLEHDDVSDLWGVVKCRFCGQVPDAPPEPEGKTFAHRDAASAELAAAERAKPAAKEWERRCRDRLVEQGPNGTTGAEAWVAFGGARIAEFHSVAPRFTKLKDDGVCVKTTTRRRVVDPSTGRSHDGNVWVLAEYAHLWDLAE